MCRTQMVPSFGNVPLWGLAAFLIIRFALLAFVSILWRHCSMEIGYLVVPVTRSAGTRMTETTS
jgi:hypothetical protein